MTYSSENPVTETFGDGAEGWHSGGAAGVDSTTGDEVLQRLENIPAELREIDGWVLFQLVPKLSGNLTRAGRPKFDKRPLQPRHPYHNASTANPGHVGTFEEAKHGLLNGSGADGLGFVLTHAWVDEPDLVGIDADGVIDPETGEVYPDKQAVMDMLLTIGSYTEVSPSGEGFRAFCYSNELAGEFNNHDMGVEVYRAGGSARFLTITGNHLPGTPKELRRVEPEELEAALEPFRQRKSITQGPGGTDLPKTPPARPEHVPALDVLPISEEFRAFLGDCDQVPEKYRTPEKPEGDRSPALLGATVAMLGAGMAPDAVHWVLMESDAYRVAEYHWVNNPEGYLWGRVRKAAATVRGPAGPEEFENLGPEESTIDPTNPLDWTKEFIVSDAEIRKLKHPEWIIPNLVIRGHLVIVPAEPNGGKTTIFNHLAGEMVQAGYRVLYVNADISGSDAAKFIETAKAGGWEALLPDLIPGMSMQHVIDRLKKMNAGGGDLTNAVFVFDTFKKMTDVISKSKVKELLGLMRSLTGKGVTIILLAHTNKYKDSDGKPVYEGTGDVRADVDELIYLIPQKHPDGSMTVSTDPDKKRGDFTPITFEIDKALNVTRAASYIDTAGARQAEEKYKNDLPDIRVILDAIEAGKRKQTEIIEHCRAHQVSKRIALRILNRYEKGPHQQWRAEREFAHNAILYYTTGGIG